MDKKNENQIKKEFTAGLVVYRNTPQGPSFLLLYHGGRYWNFPKGHIENYKDIVSSIGNEAEEINGRETSKEAAIRETQEETGISPKNLFIKKNFRAVEKLRFKKNNEQILKIVIFYLAETDETEIKISSEHKGFGWFQYKDARHILSLNKNSQRLLRSAYECINPNSNRKSFLQTKPISSKRQNDLRQSPIKLSD